MRYIIITLFWIFFFFFFFFLKSVSVYAIKTFQYDVKHILSVICLIFLCFFDFSLNFYPDTPLIRPLPAPPRPCRISLSCFFFPDEPPYWSKTCFFLGNLTSDDLWPWYVTFDLNNICKFPYCIYYPSLVAIGLQLFRWHQF